MHVLSGMHERCEERRERREERREARHERREERHHHRKDSSDSSDSESNRRDHGHGSSYTSAAAYAPPKSESTYHATSGGNKYNRKDDVADQDFEKRMAGVRIGDESYGQGYGQSYNNAYGTSEYEARRPGGNQGHQYQQQQDSYGSGVGYGSDQRYPTASQGGGSYAPPAGPPPGYEEPSDYSRPSAGKPQGHGGQSNYSRPAASESQSYGQSYGGGQSDYSSRPSAGKSQGYGEQSDYSRPPAGESQLGYGQSYGGGQSDYSRPSAGKSQGYGGQSDYSRPSAGESQGYGQGYDDQSAYSKPPPTSGSQSYGSGGNAPAGGFSLSSSRPPVRNEDNDDQGYADQASRRHGEADDYYNRGSESQKDSYTRGSGQGQSNVHETVQSRPPRPATSGEYAGDNDEDRYKPHLDAHAQAYGPASAQSNAPMSTDAIGSAAAIEALKLTAAGQGQGQGQKPPQGSQGYAASGGPGPGPGVGYGSGALSGAPAGALQANKPTGGFKPSGNDDGDGDDDDDSGPAAAAAASAGGGSMQDKIMALAMAQAGKLFDKKNGSGSGSGGEDSDGKAQAMQSAAATAMQLFSEYKSSGSIQPTDMQKLMGVAMKLL